MSEATAREPRNGTERAESALALAWRDVTPASGELFWTFLAYGLISQLTVSSLLVRNVEVLQAPASLVHVLSSVFSVVLAALLSSLAFCEFCRGVRIWFLAKLGLGLVFFVFDLMLEDRMPFETRYAFRATVGAAVLGFLLRDVAGGLLKAEVLWIGVSVLYQLLFLATFDQRRPDAYALLRNLPVLQATVLFFWHRNTGNGLALASQDRQVVARDRPRGKAYSLGEIATATFLSCAIYWAAVVSGSVVRVGSLRFELPLATVLQAFPFLLCAEAVLVVYHLLPHRNRRLAVLHGIGMIAALVSFGTAVSIGVAFSRLFSG